MVLGQRSIIGYSQGSSGALPVLDASGIPLPDGKKYREDSRFETVGWVPRLMGDAKCGSFPREARIFMKTQHVSQEPENCASRRKNQIPENKGVMNSQHRLVERRKKAGKMKVFPRMLFKTRQIKTDLAQIGLETRMFVKNKPFIPVKPECH